MLTCIAQSVRLSSTRCFQSMRSTTSFLAKLNSRWNQLSMVQMKRAFSIEQSTETKPKFTLEKIAPEKTKSELVLQAIELSKRCVEFFITGLGRTFQK